MITTIDWKDSQVRLTRRRGIKRINLKVLHTGQVIVSAPLRTPVRLISKFLDEQVDWIDKHTTSAQAKRSLFEDGDLIGKSHSLHVILDSPRMRTRVGATRVAVFLTHDMNLEEAEAQKLVEDAADKALRRQAKDKIPSRLEELAKRHNFTYADVRFKKMTSRWGSCSSRGNLNFNIHLMRLPSELIDLVLLHELTHTRHMSHSQAFWSTLSSLTEDVKPKTRQLKDYSPHW